MKTLFLDARYTGLCNFNEIFIDLLPLKIGLVTTVQYLDLLWPIQTLLEKHKKQVFLSKGKQINPSQILGCDFSSAIKMEESVDCYLYIGDGSFHPVGLSMSTKKDIFCFNPNSCDFHKLDKKIVLRFVKRRKGALVKFLSSKNIGILVSTKPGQEKLDAALELKKKLKDKNCYIFTFDTIDSSQLENFPFIESWVNTACPRISDEKAILNIDEIK